MTRSVEDFFEVLNIVVADVDDDSGDFWRQQNVVQIPKCSDTRPRDYKSLANTSALIGLRVGVPRQFVGEASGRGQTSFISRQSVIYGQSLDTT
jgi:amidase